MLFVPQTRARVGELVLIALLAASGALPAFAVEVHHFDIPEEEAAAAIRDFGEQAHVQILVAGEAVKGKKLHAVTGEFSTEDGLNSLLSGSGLTHRYVGDHSIALLAAQASGAASSTQTQLAGTGGADLGTQEGKSKSSGNFLVAQADQGQTSGSSTVERQDEQSSKKKSVQLEEVIVTGSRIPQVTKDGPSPVRSYTRVDIEQSGNTTVADFMNTLPDISISASESQFQRFVGQTTVQVHGLPVGTTLVLIDGRPVETSNFALFDLSNIPLSAVDRIEVLPVGSSAIYGSDALAGAVNIILRKDFSGFEVEAKRGHADDLNETDTDIAWGKMWNQGSISIIGSYQNRGELSGDEREATSTTNIPVSAPSFFLSDACSPGNVYSLNGQNLPGLNSTKAGIPSGTVGAPTIENFLPTAGMVNHCPNDLAGAIIPPTSRVGGLVSAHYKFADALDLFSELLYSQEHQDFPAGNLINLYGGSSGESTVPANNPYNPFGETVGISYSYPGIKRVYEESETFVRPLVGIRGLLSSDWNYEITGLLSRDHSRVDLPDAFLSGSAVEAALASTDPASAFNPFTSGLPASLQGLENLEQSATQYHYRFVNQLVEGQGILRGPLFTLPAGQVDAVFGGEYHTERQYTLLPFGSPAANPSRRAFALFTEERVPVLPNHRDPEAGANLTVTLAGRFDDSNDYGSKATGQGGIEWRPIDRILVRGGYATSYKAPQLQQITGTSSSFPEEGLIDPFRGNENITVPVVLGPNSNLKPETGRSKSFGIVYSREDAAGLEMSLTYFGIDIDNYISQPVAQVLISNQGLFPGAVVRGPPTPQDIQQGFLGPITQINDLYYNYGGLSVAGVDFDVSYKAVTTFGQLTPSIAITDTYKWLSALTPNSAAISYVSQATLFGPGFAPRWKGSVGLNWKQGPYQVNIDGRYVGRYRDYQDEFPNTNELGNFWFFDANLRYAVGDMFAHNNKWLSGAYLEFGGVNLSNKLPQYSFTVYGYDPAESDIRGRFLYGKLGLKW